MKIEDVPTDVLAESLLAVQDLRRKYLGEPQVTAYAARELAGRGACPLCIHNDSADVDVFYYPASSCVCPWIWIEGHHCCTLGSHYACAAHADCLTRIDRWEAVITEELAGRRLEVQP